MLIEIIEDEANLNTPLKKAVRAVIIKNGNLLLMHLNASNTYVLPGGGVLSGETLAEALQREILEETGYTVKQASQTLIIREYHEKTNREHHIFKTDISKDKRPLTMTDEEQTLNMTPTFIPLKRALGLLAENKGTFKYSQAIEIRELLAIMHSIQ